MIDTEKFQELLKQSRRAQAVDRARSEAFQSLVKSEGWKLYVDLIDARLQSFSDLLLQPLQSIDAVGVQEFLKGAMFAFVLMRDLPSNTINAMRSEIEDED